MPQSRQLNHSEENDIRTISKSAAPRSQTSTKSEVSETVQQLYNPNLPTDLSSLRQQLVAALDLSQYPNFYQIPQPSPAIFDPITSSNGNNANDTTSSDLDRNNILLVIPTENESKAKLLRSRLSATKPAHVRLDYCQVKARSDVGEQPYDGAGPRGAFNRVVNAVASLLADADKRAALVERPRVGTLIVGAIENFVLRNRDRDSGDVNPVDHGFVVLCRVSLVDHTWDWVVGVGRGVTVPREYYEAAQELGFEDEDEGEGGTRTCGKVTIGQLLSANAGVDNADWAKPLAGVSRYDLLREALEAMDVPWPVTPHSGAR
ncbi:hypothetical protein VTH82DRAFT_3328 [Thermothelomyces myriococcoides]